MKDIAAVIVLATLHDKPKYSAHNIASGRARILLNLSGAVREVGPEADVGIWPGWTCETTSAPCGARAYTA